MAKKKSPPDQNLGLVNEAEPIGHAAVEAACVHRCLDDRKVPRKKGGKTLSLWGRVLVAARSALSE